MFSKQDASKLKKEFWTAFGRYMKPVLSADGEKINWINYKTGEKDIVFKMDADSKKAFIAIEIVHPDFGMQELYFEQFIQLKKVFENGVGSNWIWSLHTSDEDGRTISRIYRQINEVSVFNKADWPALISFLKPAIIALDKFWSNARYSFQSLH
ncbi:MAG: DUF4268 domain-containing protein [Segetibacter sp.]